MDPETGNGAYKISGGKNGAQLFLVGFALTFISVLLIASAVGGTGGAIVATHYDLIVGLLVACGLIMAAGFALLDGNTQLCADLLASAVGILFVALTLTSIVGKFLTPLFSMLIMGGAVGYASNNTISHVCK